MAHIVYTLVSPAGKELRLATSASEPGDFGLLDDSQGFGMADRDVKIASTVGAGGRLRTVRVPPRPGVLSVLVQGDDDDSLRANFRALAEAVRYVEGLPLPAMRVDFSTGESYSLPFLYESGADTGKRSGGTIAVPLNVIFPDPFWTAIDASQFRVLASTATVGLLPDLAALHVAPSTTSGDVIVTNPGEVPAFIAWTLTGPASLVEVSLGSQSWSLGPIAAGEVVSVDTRTKRVTLADGTNVYTRLGDAPKLFALPAGTSDLVVNLEGATADSRVTGYFRPRLEVLT